MFSKIKNTWMKIGFMAMTVMSCVHASYATGNKFDPFSDISFGDQGVNVGTNIDNTDLDYGSILVKYKSVLSFLGGFIIITAFGMMLFRFYRLAASSSNDMERRKAIRGILTTGISLMLLGSFSLIVGIAYGAFN